jgi:MarR family transcriptional regulator, lower aerobic nicotinate degradation pathway regulator
MIPTLLEDGLGFNLYRAGLLMRRELMGALAEQDITPEQWQILAALWESKHPISQRGLGEMLLKDKPTVSRTLSRMERDGWISRAPDPRDARVTLVTLTGEGKALKRVLPKKLFAHFNTLVQDFSERELTDLLSLLRKLRHALGDE